MATVYWKVLSTGYTGHGSSLDPAIAQAWVKEKRKQEPNTIKYWINYDI